MEGEQENSGMGKENLGLSGRELNLHCGDGVKSRGSGLGGLGMYGAITSLIRRRRGGKIRDISPVI